MFIGTLNWLGDDEQLTERLNAITIGSSGTPPSLSVAESESLKFIHEDSNPSIKGQVYLKIEKMYARDTATNHQKVVEYCQKALATSIDASDTCKLYMDWGFALESQYKGPHDTEMRRKITVPYLRGFKFVSTDQIPEKLQPRPIIARIDFYPSETNAFNLARMKEYHDEVEAFEKVDRQNKLATCRANLVDRFVSVYGRSPEALEELKAAATEELHDQSVIDDLIKRVKDSAGSNALENLMKRSYH